MDESWRHRDVIDASKSHDFLRGCQRSGQNLGADSVLEVVLLDVDAKLQIGSWVGIPRLRSGGGFFRQSQHLPRLEMDLQLVHVRRDV